MEKTTILFDMDNTLIDRVQAAQKTYRYIVENTFPEADDDFKQKMFERLWGLDDNGDMPKRKLYTIVAEEYGLSAKWAEDQIFEVWNKIFPLNTVIFEHTIETLEILKKNYKIGILTNGLYSNQHTKYLVAGLDKVVDKILIGGSVNMSKPDPELFQLSLQMMESTAEETYFVGDNIRRDIEGSMKMGMTPIYIWRDDSKPCPYDVPHIYTIEQLLEVIPCPIK